MSTLPKDSRETSRYHHLDLRQTLMDAALAALDEHGAGGLGLRELARATGVSAAAPYRHFKSREALLAAVAATGFDRFAAALAASTRGIPPKYHLAVMGMAYVDFARTNRALFQLMFSPELDKSAHEDLRTASEAAFGILSRTAGEEYPEKARETALAAWALVHGLAQLTNDGQFPPMGEGETRALIASILKRSIEGMRASRPSDLVAH